MDVATTINGEARTIETTTGESLASALRSAGYTGVKCGCDGGDCGASTVLVDNEPTMACGIEAAEADGSSIETIGALGTQDDLHPLQQAFVDNFAVQCGFCVPGMIMQSKAFLGDNPDPTAEEVRAAIDDVVCRCTGYQKQVEAILDAAGRMREDPSVAADGGTVAADGESVAADAGTVEYSTDCGRADCCGGDGHE